MLLQCCFAVRFQSFRVKRACLVVLLSAASAFFSYQVFTFQEDFVVSVAALVSEEICSFERCVQRVLQ